MEKYKLDRPSGAVEIRIPTTAQEWELYSGRGSANAARALTAALKRSMRAFPKFLAEGHPVAEALGKACRCKGGFDEAQDKYASLGAADTEPRNHGHQALIDYAKAHLFGRTDSYMPELGDWL